LLGVVAMETSDCSSDLPSTVCMHLVGAINIAPPPHTKFIKRIVDYSCNTMMNECERVLVFCENRKGVCQLFCYTGKRDLYLER